MDERVKPRGIRGMRGDHAIVKSSGPRCVVNRAEKGARMTGNMLNDPEIWLAGDGTYAPSASYHLQPAGVNRVAMATGDGATANGPAANDAAARGSQADGPLAAGLHAGGVHVGGVHAGGSRAGAAVGGAPIAVLAKELHVARRKRMLSLEQLAALSGVSRSMISKVERGQAVPSTTVLAKLAEALGVTFAQLMSHPIEREVLVIEAARQPVLADAASGLVRRCLSPVLPGRGIDFLLNTLPPRGSASLFGAHRRGVEQYVYVHQGTLEAGIGNERHVLRTGDSLYFQADATHAFTNIGGEDCVYFLIIDSSRLYR